MSRSRGLTATALLACAAVLSAGDIGVRAAGSPRIELERVIATSRDLATRRSLIVSRLTGKADEPLFQRPYGIAWDGNDLIVTDPAAQRVLRVHGNSITSSPRGAVDDPVGVAVCEAGIVVTDARAGGVALLDKDLRRTRWLAEGLARPTGVACSGDRIAIVETAAHRVLILDAAGSTVRVVGGRGNGSAEFNYPAATAASGGHLFVGDTLNFRVQQIDLASGTGIGVFGDLGDVAGTMPRIKGMAVDSQQRLWITDAYLDNIAIYTADGTLLTDFGRAGDGPGEFAFPAGIAVAPDGHIAVADSLNRRVQVFRLVDVGAKQ